MRVVIPANTPVTTPRLRALGQTRARTSREREARTKKLRSARGDIQRKSRLSRTTTPPLGATRGGIDSTIPVQMPKPRERRRMRPEERQTDGEAA